MDDSYRAEKYVCQKCRKSRGEARAGQSLVGVAPKGKGEDNNKKNQLLQMNSSVVPQKNVNIW